MVGGKKGWLVTAALAADEVQQNAQREGENDQSDEDDDEIGHGWHECLIRIISSS